LELKWNGAKLLDVETMLGWAKKMTWKGLQPVVELSRQAYTKGIALGKVAMEAVEARLKVVYLSAADNCLAPKTE
jgi:hypothetical protein